MKDLHYEDGTVHAWGFDAHHNRTSAGDPNGSAVTSTFDRLNRLLTRTIVPGAEVASDTLAESYLYDGASRLILAEDDDSIVGRGYDSMGNLTRDTILFKSHNNLTRHATAVYDNLGNRKELHYPGGRFIESGHDALNRLQTLMDNGAANFLAEYKYIGPAGRVEYRQTLNDVRQTTLYNDLKQPFGVQSVRHPGLGQVELDTRFNAWDKVFNRKSRTRLGRPCSYVFFSTRDVNPADVRRGLPPNHIIGCIRAAGIVIIGCINISEIRPPYVVIGRIHTRGFAENVLRASVGTAADRGQERAAGQGQGQDDRSQLATDRIIHGFAPLTAIATGIRQRRPRSISAIDAASEKSNPRANGNIAAGIAKKPAGRLTVGNIRHPHRVAEEYPAIRCGMR